MNFLGCVVVVVVFVLVFVVGLVCFLFVVDVVIGFVVNFLIDDCGKFIDDEFIYVISLGFDLIDNMNVYFIYLYGYKVGGFNFDLIVVIGGVDLWFGVEIVDFYELGLKGKFFDNWVSVNLVVFYMLIDDF